MEIKRKLTQTLKKIDFKGKICKNTNTCANKINEFFVNNVKKIIDDINSRQREKWEEDINNNVVWNSFEKVTVTQVDKIIKNLDCKKGSKI